MSQKIFLVHSMRLKVDEYFVICIEVPGVY